MTSDMALLIKALKGASGGGRGSDIESMLERVAEGLLAASNSSGRPVGEILVGALPSLPMNLLAPPGTYERRAAVKYEARAGLGVSQLTYVSDLKLQPKYSLVPTEVAEIVKNTNVALLALEVFGTVLRVSVAELLQLRNLSGMVGAVLITEMERHSKGKLLTNPHQDGYPDLLAQTPTAIKYQKSVKAAGQDSAKESWTGTKYGGVEVKATVGSTPPAREMPKPGLGVERASIIRGFDWKAHHRDTNNLLGITWDFVDGVPTISAAFYRNDLVPDDWGKVVMPKEGGGRTTSVSTMKQKGVKRMAERWLVRSLDDGMRAGLKNGKLLLNDEALDTD